MIGTSGIVVPGNRQSFPPGIPGQKQASLLWFTVQFAGGKQQLLQSTDEVYMRKMGVGSSGRVPVYP
jgi:hypothetical protein